MVSLKRRKLKEKVGRYLLQMVASFSILITLGIIGILLSESRFFFTQVSLREFLTDTEWTPLFSEAHYGILPLLSGTMVTAGIALLLALPLGSVIAIFLSEYAPPWLKEIVKPVLELLSAIPTVVFGYFALLWVTPFLQRLIPDLPGFNMLSAGLTMGIMIIPYISSLSEDAMRAVPMSLREASFSLGATRLQTATRVVVPAAFSGIASAYALGFARAIGETMVVAIAAGMQANLTWDPRQPAETITAYIVQVCLGDLPHGSTAYQTIFAAGLTLFLVTFLFNLIGASFRRRFRESY